jgi:hypothetical protein
MACTIKEFREWLEMCHATDDDALAIDDGGGLSMVLLDDEGVERGARFDVGGVPLPDGER